jgi:hypothetical protein
MTNLMHFVDIWGYALLICRFFDGFKYHLQANKIRKCKSGRGHSRDFGNIALLIDIFMLMYFIYKTYDLYMIISTLIIIAFVVEFWITLYLYYPYRMRGCSNFRRPSILAYFLNSIQFDKYRKRL